MKKISILEIRKWPASWANCKDDILYGQRLKELMKPFIKELLNSAYSPSTIKRHFDNLFVLGRFTIDQLNYYENDRKVEPHLLLTQFIDSGDGPLIHDFSESAQGSFDSTCRIFYKYLVNNVLRKNRVRRKTTESGTET